VFSVVVPSKTVSNLRACVGAIRKHEPDLLPANIIVVDDATVDQDGEGEPMLEACKELSVTWLRGKKPFVYAANCNLGMKVHQDHDIILLNDDALLQSPKGFSILEQAANEHPEYGIIGVTTNVTGQRLQFRLPRPIGLRTVPHIAFVGVYIPRRTVEKVGYLDERYCLDYGVEDRDYCEAVTRAGLKIGVHDHCYVDHGSLVSSFRGDPKTPASFQKNQALFNEKWGVRA
jgi:GT2 family glycosyltransferase